MSVLAFCSGLLVGLDSCFLETGGVGSFRPFLFQGLVTSTLLAHFSFLPGMSLGFTFLLAPHFVPLCSASFRAVPFMKTFLLALASAQGFSELPLFLCGSSLRGLVLSDFFFQAPEFFGSLRSQVTLFGLTHIQALSKLVGGLEAARLLFRL